MYDNRVYQVLVPYAAFSPQQISLGRVEFH
jgi:hypothetical protein